MSEETLLLIDGHGLAYRAFFALPELSAPDGTPTGAVVGFANMLFKILEQWKPSGGALVFDAPGPTFRHEAYEAYKEGRAPMPDTLRAQIPLLHELGELLGISVVARPGVEADDVLGATALEACARRPVLVVTADKDLFQLLRPGLRVLRPRKGVSEFTLYDEDLFREEYGFPPDRFREYLALVGDAADHVPGVPGVGDKGARKLLTTYRGLEEIYEDLERHPAALRRKLEDGRASAFASRELVTLRREDPLEEAALAFSPPRREELGAFCRRLGLARMMERLGIVESLARPISEAVDEAPPPSLVGREVAPEDLSPEGLLALVEVEDKTSGLREFWGGSAEGARARFIHRDDVGAFCRGLLPEATVVTARYKELCAALPVGSLPPEKVWDAQVAHYLLHPDRSSREYPSLLPEDPREGLAALWRLQGALAPELERQGLGEVFRTMDVPLCPVLAAMEQHGLGLHVGRFEALERDLGERIALLEGQLRALAGGDLNPNSPKQVAAFLFDRLGLPPQKKIKTGYSTDVAVLEILARLPQGEAPRLLLEHRELAKILSGFVQPFLRARNEATGCVHATFEHTVTGTGRLSSANPNVQNLPAYGEWAKRFREGVVPRTPGHVFVAGDYSQIELRVLAHLSGEERLIQAFRDRRDVHAETAEWLFGPGSGTGESRRIAKMINFGLLYGMGTFGLAERLGIGRREAALVVERHTETFPRIHAYLRDSAEEARGRGYTRTVFGRRRPLGEVVTTEGRGGNALQRVAVNAPIQGTAADIAKLAMVAWAREGRAPLVLQVHDSLVVETSSDQALAVGEELARVMTSAASLVVPLEVEIKRGESLAEV